MNKLVEAQNEFVLYFSDNIPNRQSLQAFAHHSTHSALEASTFHSLHTRFAHQLIVGASVEQNSIGRTQIITSQGLQSDT
jgi:hypothetical protein